MPTSPTITPEQRKRIAEACTGHEHIVVDGTVWRNFMGGPDDPFRPEICLEHKYALTRAVAQAILDECLIKEHRLEQFAVAIATNDVNALEALLLELINHE